jgi:REP element-mobilizing transposase RayT
MTSVPKLPGHRALRLGRYSEPGRVYLLTTVTHERTRWFNDFKLACLVSRLHLDPSTFGGARCLAWVLMPDHWHGLIELGEGHDLGRVMQRFKSRSSFKVTQSSGCPGPVWARGYHDHAMRADADIRRAAPYLVANPLRAGLVDRVGAYPFWDAVWM